MGVLQQFLLASFFCPMETFPASRSICNTSDCGFWTAFWSFLLPLEPNSFISPLLTVNLLGFVVALCFIINDVFYYSQYFGQCRRNYAFQFRTLLTHN